MKKSLISTITACILLALFAFGCVKYSEADAPETLWVLTQHGDPGEHKQSLFYTIKGNHDKLILIDGGWRSDADYVRQTVAELGGRIDLWIITHPHPDHVGAFNEIAADPQGIEIGEVLSPEIPAQLYRENAQSWDGYEDYEAFQELVAAMPQAEYLYRDTEFEFSGLKFEVFNSYFDGLDLITRDICNDSSLVFRVSGQERSMLFTGDINSRIGKVLAERYGKRLRSDYLQVPHHGGNKKRKSFFKEVAAEKAFIDAPDYLFEKPELRRNVKILKRLGTEVYTYSTENNAVVLR